MILYTYNFIKNKKLIITISLKDKKIFKLILYILYAYLLNCTCFLTQVITISISVHFWNSTIKHSNLATVNQSKSAPNTLAHTFAEH